MTINSKNMKSVLLEISNNAIETMFKAGYPELRPYMNHTLKQISCVDWEGNVSDEEHYYGLRKILGSAGITRDDVNENPNMKLKDFMRLNILSKFHINRGSGPLKFLKGIVRICCTDIPIYSSQLTITKDNLKTFTKIVDYIYQQEMNYDEDLNGLSFDELCNQTLMGMRRFHIKNWSERKNSAPDSASLGEYNVIPIPDYETAKQYAQYTSWCVTHSSGAFNSYTIKGEEFFFCLKEGFENVEKKIGDGCPLDDYGLSMVAVCVQTDGTPAQITTRWNHDLDKEGYIGENNERLKTLEQVEARLGIPSSVFTNHKRPAIELEDIDYLLKNTDIPLEDIFNSCDNNRNRRKGAPRIVRFDEMDKRAGYTNFCTLKHYNIVINRRLVSQEWFVYAEFIDEKLIAVQCSDGLYNVYNNFGKRLFRENLPGLPKLYDKEKKILLITHDKFHYNLINLAGEYMFKDWVQEISPFYGNYAKIVKGGEINFMNKDYKVMWQDFMPLKLIKPRFMPEWSEGICIVSNGNYGQTYFSIEKCSTLIKDPDNRWFDSCDGFVCGFGVVMRWNGDKKVYNCVDLNGKMASNEWYPRIRPSLNNNVIVTNEEHLDNVLTPDKQLYFDEWKGFIFFFDGEYGAYRQQKGDNTTIVFKDKKTLFVIENLDVYKRYPNGTFLGFETSSDFPLVFLNEKGEVIGNFNMVTGEKYYEGQDGRHYNINIETGEITLISNQNAEDYI
jgi:hypothetical protein